MVEAAQRRALEQLDQRIVAEITAAGERTTLAQAVTRLPGWLAAVGRAAGRPLDLADPEPLWAEIDGLVSTLGDVRPPPTGVLAVLALAAAQALRERTGGRLGTLTDAGFAGDDELAWAATGYQPAVSTPAAAGNLGRRVFERYQAGPRASVLALGRQLLQANAAAEQVLPCLQPFDFARPGVRLEPLFGRIAIPGVPRVSYVVDALTVRKLVPDGPAHPDLRADAVAALEARPWPPFAPFEGGVVLEAEYAEGLVLSAATLRRVAARLGAEVLLVAVPRRGVLLAAPGPDDADRVEALARIAGRILADSPSGDRLTTGVLVVRDGEGVRFVAGPTPPAAALPAPVEVDGRTVTVRLGAEHDRTVSDAVLPVARGVGAPIRLVVRIEGPATPAQEVEVLTVAAVAVAQLSAFGVPVAEVVAQVGDDAVTSALDGLDPAHVQALALAPAAVVLTLASVRGGLSEAQLEAIERHLEALFDRRLIEAFLVEQRSFRDGLAALLNQPDQIRAVLARAGEALGRVPVAEAQRTGEALMQLGVFTVAAGGERVGPEHKELLVDLVILLGIGPAAPPEH